MVTPEGHPLNIRHNPEAIMARALDREHSNFAREAEFWLVHEADVELVLVNLANHNPGCEVRVYNCEQIAQAPAGEIVRKKIDASGVLPG